jgi:hypothetical protein
MFAAALPAYGLTKASMAARSVASVTVVEADGSAEGMSVLDSLKGDVAHHPNDFIRFETKSAANQFIAEHEGAAREMDRRVVERGIVGYWQGKTLVLPPSLSRLTMTRR